MTVRRHGHRDPSRCRCGAQDAAGNGNGASTSTDNTVTYDAHPARRSRSIRRPGQADPTNGPPINFTVVFSEPVTDFATGGRDAVVAPPARRRQIVTGGGTDVQRGGQRDDGRRHRHRVTIAAGGAERCGRQWQHAPRPAPTTPSPTTRRRRPSRSIRPRARPIRPTPRPSTSPSSSLSRFPTLRPGTSRSEGPRSDDGSRHRQRRRRYNVAVSGMTDRRNGRRIGSQPASRNDAATNASTASTSTDNIVTFDTTPPHVTINQAFLAGRTRPTARRLTSQSSSRSGTRILHWST